MTQVKPITELTEDELFFNASVRDFIAKKISRQALREMDLEGKFSSSLIEDFFEAGYMGIEVPEIYGGAGASLMYTVQTVYELSKVDPVLGVFIDVQNTLVNYAFEFGPEHLKKKYLPGLVTNKVGAYALTEPESGSDAFALRTATTIDGDHYLLNGGKVFITNALEAEIFIVFATIDRSLGHKGIVALVIEKNFPGFQIVKNEKKMGLNASSTCQLAFENCRAPRENLLAEPGQGYKVIMGILNKGRLGIAAQGLGMAEGALRIAIEYAREREQFGKKIKDFQAVSHPLAQVAAEIEAAKCLLYNSVRIAEKGGDFRTESAMTKLICTELAVSACEQAVRTLGGYGCMHEYDVERFHRAALLPTRYEGTSEMQRETIAKSLFL